MKGFAEAPDPLGEIMKTPTSKVVSFTRTLSAPFFSCCFPKEKKKGRKVVGFGFYLRLLNTTAATIMTMTTTAAAMATYATTGVPPEVG